MPRKQSNPKGVTAAALLQEDNRKAQRLMQALALAPLDGDVVEVGCLRTPSEWAMDGWSTVYLAEHALGKGQRFCSYDIEPEAVRIANAVLASRGIPELVDELDGAQGIRLHERIAFLYLDGSDDPAETLALFKEAEELLVPGAIIACDDVQMYDWNKLQGKGTELIPYLQALGVQLDVYATHPGFSMMTALWPRTPAAGG